LDQAVMTAAFAAGCPGPPAAQDAGAVAGSPGLVAAGAVCGRGIC
jgi:hypothetical protein